MKEEIKKRDYSEEEEDIIQDLELLGEESMVHWLTRNPPQKHNNQLLSIELATRLKEAKEYAKSEIDLVTLPTIKGSKYANLRQVITGSPWQNQLRRDE